MITRAPVSEYYAQNMLLTPNIHCRIDGCYLIIDEEVRHLIREKALPTISMEELDMLKYGKDYTMKGGIITLTNGTKYAIPLFTQNF